MPRDQWFVPPRIVMGRQLTGDWSEPVNRDRGFPEHSTM